MTDPDIAVPNFMLPPDTKIRSIGFNDCDETQAFLAALTDVILHCSETMDLARLDGITVGFDFDIAVQSVDLGFDSEHAKTYTNDGDFICVAKALNVIRKDRIFSHVVYNANLISAISDANHPDYLHAAHIIAHELGHVAELKWRDEAMPGVILKYRSPDWVNGLLLQVAVIVWEEYAACRLTARWSDAEKQAEQYAASFELAAGGATPRSNAAIRRYREHADVGKLLTEAGKDLAPAVKALGYLLGHLDGCDFPMEIETRCPGHISTIYFGLVPRFHEALRDIWDARDHWQGMEIFDALKGLMAEVFRAAGIDLIEHAEGYYVDVPFTLETL